MHVAVLGAGALGRILGVRLALRAQAEVDFVVRASQLGGGAIAIERVAGESLTLDVPSRVTEIPPHADVVIACVRANQLDDDLIALLRRGPSVPVAIVTPMLPRTYARMEAALPGRVVAAVPGITGYTDAAGVTRHWISRTARTLFEEPRRPEPILSALLEALGGAGIDARFELGAHESSAATVIAVLPVFLAIDAAGSIDALLEDAPLSRTMFRAVKEARALADRCGEIASWARALDRFLGPLTLRVGLALGRRRSPEIVSFVEERFGRRARAQNVALAAEVLELAGEKGVASEALRDLAGRLV